MQRLARCYHAPDETVFFEIMPVGRRYLAATIGASAFECPAGPVSALLVSWRVFINKKRVQFSSLGIFRLRHCGETRPRGHHR